MSLIRTLLSAEAALKQKAVRKTCYRHRKLSDESLVITLFNLSGEAAAPLVICYGTDAEEPHFTVSAEPRNRTSRFTAIQKFAASLGEYLESYLELTEEYDDETDEVKLIAQRTPQVITPNRSTLSFLGRLGRALRYLQDRPDYPVAEEISWLGAHLTWLSDRSNMPGQSVMLSATQLLSSCFATGQSEMEDENLASLLAWICNEEESGLEHIFKAERTAYGPSPSTDFERELAPEIEAWTEADRAGDITLRAQVEERIADLARGEILPAYQATHNAIRLLRQIDEARSVERRWAQDLRSWGFYAVRCQNGIPTFKRRQDPIRAASTLERWSSALERLEFDEAMDDPLILAEHDAAGRCLVGRVTDRDMVNREIKPQNSRETLVPLITIQLMSSTMLLAGEDVIWTGSPSVKAEIRELGGGEAVIAIMSGHKNGTRSPHVGDEATFAAISYFGGPPPRSPEDVPWTHRGSDHPQSDQTPPAEGAEGSLGLSIEELILIQRESSRLSST